MPTTPTDVMRRFADSGVEPYSSPEDAASILRKFLRMSQSGQEVGGGAGTADASGILDLRSLRDARKGEAEDRLAADLGTGDVRDAARQTYLSHNIGQDMAEDPYTGDAAHEKLNNIDTALTNAEMTGRPEIGDAANAVSSRNAFGEFLKQKAGFQAQISPEGKAALDAEMRRKQALASPTTGLTGAPTGSGSADSGESSALAGLTPEAATTVKALANYDLPLPSGTALRTPYWQTLFAKAKEYDPSFDVKEYSVRQGLRKDFTTGKAATNIKALNTLASHLDELSSASEGLNNRSGLGPLTQPYNKFANWMETLSGDPAQTRFEGAKAPVASEYAAALKSSGATDQEISHMTSLFDKGQSPDQQKAALATAAHIVKGRLDALRAQYEEGFKKPANFNIVEPKSEEIFNRLGGGTSAPRKSSLPPGVTVTRIP